MNELADVDLFVVVALEVFDAFHELLDCNKAHHVRDPGSQSAFLLRNADYPHRFPEQTETEATRSFSFEVPKHDLACLCHRLYNLASSLSTAGEVIQGKSLIF